MVLSPRLRALRYLRVIRRLWLILAMAGLMLSPTMLLTQAAAVEDVAATGAMPDCEGSSLAPDCNVVCPPGSVCPSAYGPVGFLIGAATCDALVSVANLIPGDETVPGPPDEERVFPPPRI
jgi:hypothetical protein